MNISDLSWMEKPDRGRNEYLIFAVILLGILVLGYLGTQPSLTGYTVFESGSVSLSVDFGSQKLPLGSNIEATINGQKQTKNLISLLGSPYEIEYQGATIYGWDTSLVVPLETFDIVNTLKPGSYAVDLVLSYNNEIIDLKTITVEIIETRQPETPTIAPIEPAPQQPVESPEFISTEPVVQEPIVTAPITAEPFPEFLAPVAPEPFAETPEPTFMVPEELMNGSNNDSNNSAVLSSNNFTVSGSPPDIDGDRFLSNAANSTHPQDCDDTSNLTRPLVNGTNNSIVKNLRICPGTYNSIVTIDNDTVTFDCNGTVSFQVANGIGNSSYMIQSSGFDNINVTGCTLANTATAGHGIRFSAATNIKINSTTLANSTTGIVLNNTNDSAINGVTIDNIITNDAIRLTSYSYYTNISSNRISNILTTTSSAINLNGATTNATIINNTIFNVGKGIQALATNSGPFSSASIPYNTTITDNTIYNATVYAILSNQDIGSEPNVPKNLSITKNFIANSTVGIQLQRTGNSTLSDNHLFNNTMQLNATNASGSTIINTILNSTFTSLIDEGTLTVSVLNHTFRNANGIVNFPNFNTTATQNFSSNRTDVNMTNELLFLDPLNIILVQNSTFLWSRFNTTFQVPPAVFKNAVACDSSTCILAIYNSPLMVVQVTGAGTYTVVQRNLDDFRSLFPHVLMPTAPRSFTDTSGPPAGMLVPFDFSGARATERATHAAESASPSAPSKGAGMKSYTPKRLAFGEGLGLLEAKQDGKIVFVNNKFGTDITFKPDQTSTIEFTVVNTGTEVLNSIVLDVDAPQVNVLSQSSLHTEKLSRGEKAVFIVTFQPSVNHVTEKSIALRWHAGASYLNKEFNVRVEAQPESRVAAAFIFKQWAAPSITVLVMFLTGTLLLVGIQTFAGGQVEKITQGFIGPLFRDTLVDDETLRRLVRSKFLSHYGTLWATRGAYLKFKPQFPQLKLVTLNDAGRRAATEANARFHVGMELATLIAFATRKKLIAQLDLMPGKILTMQDLSSDLQEEFDGVEFMNPFGTDIAPDKKLVLDSCLSLPEYTAVIIEHFVAGLADGKTYEQLAARLQSAGWPANKIGHHVTALKAELGYLERAITGIYYYAGFDLLKDEVTTAKTCARFTEHGHDHRLVDLAFKQVKHTYFNLYRFITLGLKQSKPVPKIVDCLLRMGYEQRLIDRIVMSIQSKKDEKKDDKKKETKKQKEQKEKGFTTPTKELKNELKQEEQREKKKEEQREEKKKETMVVQPIVSQPVPLPLPLLLPPPSPLPIVPPAQPPSVPVPMVLGLDTTPVTLSMKRDHPVRAETPVTYLDLSPTAYDVACGNDHVLTAPPFTSLRTQTSADFFAFKTKLLQKEICYLRTRITAQVFAILTPLLSSRDVADKLDAYLKILITAGHDAALVRRLADDVLKDVGAVKRFIVAASPFFDALLVKKKLASAGWNPALVEKLVVKPIVPSVKSVVQPRLKTPLPAPVHAVKTFLSSIKESLAVKLAQREQEYLRSVVDRRFATLRRVDRATLEKHFVADLLAVLVTKGHDRVVAEPVVINRFRELMATYRESAKQAPVYPVYRRRESTFVPSVSLVPASPISPLAAMKQKLVGAIAAREETAIRDYVEHQFAIRRAQQPLAALEKMFLPGIVNRLIEKGYGRERVMMLAQVRFGELVTRAKEEQEKQSPRVPIKKVAGQKTEAAAKKKPSPRLTLQRGLLDYVINARKRGIAQSVIVRRLNQAGWPVVVIELHVRVAEKELSVLGKKGDRR